MESIIKEYEAETSWRLKENANFNKSFTGEQAYISNRFLARHALKIMPDDIPFADYKIAVRASTSGRVAGISNNSIAHVAKLAGAPKDRLAGILLNKKIGYRVKKGEILFTIFAEKRDKLNKAYKCANRIKIFTVKR